MATITLDDVNKTLVKQNNKLDSIGSSFDAFFKELQRSRLDQLEKDRENTKASAVPAKVSAANKPDSGFDFGLLAPAALLAPLLASVTAFGAALAGLRGWEIGAAKSIGRSLRGFVRSTIQGARTFTGDLMTRIMTSFKNFGSRIMTRYFGFTPEGGQTRNARGQFAGRAGSVMDQLRGRFAAYRRSVMSSFGIGGRVARAAGAGAAVARPLMTVLTTAIDAILTPVRMIATAASSFATGIGRPLLDGLRALGGGAGGFIRMFGTILKPIGFLFSAFDGIKAFMDSDAEGLLSRIGDGFGAFIGDFFGVPFDLLKSGIRWIFNKIFGLEVGPDGQVAGDGWAAWASNAMANFSFEETINGLVQAPFDMLQGAVNWVKLLFNDPGAALSALWSGVYGEEGIFNMLIWKPISMGINWIAEKFGWKEEGAPDFDLRTWVVNLWTGIVDKVKNGFIDFGNWLASIPARIKVAAFEAIRSTGAVGEFFIDDEKFAAAQAQVAAFDAPAPTVVANDLGEDPRRDQIAPIIIQDNSTKEGDVTTSSSSSVLVPGEAGYDPYLNTGGANYNGGG